VVAAPRTGLTPSRRQIHAQGYRHPTTHTPGRRGLLGGAAALLAGAAAATLPRVALAAGTGPDAELIRLCDRLVEIDAEERAILASTDEDDGGPLKPRYDALNVEWHAIDARLCDVADPVTKAGALAVARAAVAQAPRQTDGSFSTPELAEWLAFTAAAWFAAEGVA
jgi:hypothetical protein